MVALTSTIWRKNSACRKNNSAFSAKGRIFRPFFFFSLLIYTMRYNPRFLHPQGTKNGQTLCSGPQRARWALWLTLLYLGRLAGRRLSAGGGYRFYRPAHWFEMACLLVPLLFILLCWAMVKLVFRDIPLEDDDAV